MRLTNTEFQLLNVRFLIRITICRRIASQKFGKLNLNIINHRFLSFLFLKRDGNTKHLEGKEKREAFFGKQIFVVGTGFCACNLTSFSKSTKTLQMLIFTRQLTWWLSG